MSNSLVLDDYAMALLRQLSEAYDDLDAVWALGERDEEETIHIYSDNGISGTFTFPPTDVRERRTRITSLIDDLVDHILALEPMDGIPTLNVLDNHITLHSSILETLRTVRFNHPFIVEGIMRKLVELSRSP